MLRFLRKTLAIAATLGGMAMMASPEAVFSQLGWSPGLSDTMARGVGAVITIVSFAIFSGPSKFGAAEEEPPPQIPVDHLITSLRTYHPELVEQVGEESTLRDVLRHLAARRKIGAIKLLRIATGRDLKDSKELVESIQQATG
jgi:hypothetical protein